MKNVKVYLTALLLSFSILFSNCTPDKNFVIPTEQVLISHPWSIDYYFQSQDMTSQFGPYTLLFSSTGTAAAQKGTEYYPGTWSRSVDADNYEVISIHFTSGEPNLDFLNLNWRLMNRSSNTLEFVENNTASSLRIKMQ